MMRFAPSDRDFDSCKVDIPKSKKQFEIIKTGKNEFTLLEHMGDSVNGIYEFTYDELKTLWLMLTTNK